MKATENNRTVVSGYVLMLLISTYLWPGVTAARTGDIPAGSEAGDFGDFYQALEASDDAKATSIGDAAFGRLEQKYRSNTGFVAFKSKLKAADFLARQMVSQLNKAKMEKMRTVAETLFGTESSNNRSGRLLVAPARSYYETSLKLFSRPVTIAGLQQQEKTFLGKYYDFKLSLFTVAVAKAGQALVVAEPGFEGTHDYVLVLPLLHASDRRPVDIAILPRWMQQPEQLRICSDSCLLSFGLPFHTMMIAKQAARMGNGPFSEIDFYRSAARKSQANEPHLAVDCLERAMTYVSNNDSDTLVNLEFEIVQLWLNSGNYALAASRARKIYESFPNHEQAGKAVWLYFYALSRSNNTDEILSNIDSALADNRCSGYRSKLMYIKWWALRRRRDQAARIAALEYELLTSYSDDPMVAPILLSRATDLLASQNYAAAYESLRRLVEKFPSTNAAEQAKRMLEKLKTAEAIR